MDDYLKWARRRNQVRRQSSALKAEEEKEDETGQPKSGIKDGQVLAAEAVPAPRKRAVPQMTVEIDEDLLKPRDLSYNPQLAQILATRIIVGLTSLVAFSIAILWVVTIVLNNYCELCVHVRRRHRLLELSYFDVVIRRQERGDQFHCDC